MREVSNPTVSIIMPISGNIAWLEEALQSVLGQTFSSWEFLAYVDGENPEAEEILRAFGPRFTYQTGKVRVGPAVARNLCILRAKGTYVAALDSDDKWDREHLAKSVDALTRTPGSVLVACIPIHIDEASRRTPLRFKNRNSGPAWRLLVRNQVGNSGAVFHRASAIQCGMYDPLVSVSHDYCLWLRLATVGQVHIDSSRHFFYRIHSGQVSSVRVPRESLRIVGSAREQLAIHLAWPLWLIRIWQKIWEFYRQFGPIKILQTARGDSQQLQPHVPILPSSLRIMHVINSLRTGGAESLVVELCTQARDDGHRPFIVCLTEGEGVPRRTAKERGLEVIELGKSRFNPKIPALLKRASKNADIVHSHLFPSTYWSTILPLPKVTTEHSTTNRRRNSRLARIPEKEVYSSYDRLISISAGVKSALSEHLQVLNCRAEIVTILNAVAKKFNHPPRLEVGPSPRVMFVGSLRRIKDPLLALKVLTHLPDMTLTFVGSGPLLRSLIRQSNRLGLASRVTFVGEKDSVEEMLQSHDLFLSTSHFEGFGLAALEAQASGLPVVGPDVPGLREVVVDGESGYLYRSRNPLHIASLIGAALEPRNYVKLSERAHLSAQRFSIQESTNSHIRLYKDVIGLA